MGDKKKFSFVKFIVDFWSRLSEKKLPPEYEVAAMESFYETLIIYFGTNVASKMVAKAFKEFQELREEAIRFWRNPN